jgi:EAL domain-containing protein (putative c-di-GMP-specific phosphodiesterase class I)
MGSRTPQVGVSAADSIPGICAGAAGEGLTTGANGTHIVRAILELARGTGLSVVAEGVETEDQRNALRRLDCGYGQGYLFDRPLHVTGLERLLQDEDQQAS